MFPDCVENLKMTIKFSLISSIRPGKSDWKLKVRVLRLWYVAEFKNPNERNSIEMIILDEKVRPSLFYYL